MASTIHPRRSARIVGLASVAVVLGGILTAPGGSPAVAAPPPADRTTTRTLGVQEALARAKQTGQAVEATGAGTSASTLTANPDGTLALTQTAVPTRKLVDGTWRPLDPTLRRNADGTVSPTTTTHALTLSGGGTGPMATMVSGDRSLALSLPFTLPAPTLAGDTATYAGVLPGVDLVLTASREGGLSHVLVVRDGEAAANPALRRLTLGTRTSGVSLGTDQAGNIVGRDRTGQVVLTAPKPMAWDSGRAEPVGGSATERGAEVGQGPDVATVRGPAPESRIATLTATVADGKIELVPQSTLLTGANTTFPVFLDPTFEWASSGAAKSGWATISRMHQSTNYWNNTPDPEGRMQIGNSGEQWSHTLINFPIAVSTLRGATISSATFKITNSYSYSCTKSRINLYAPSTTLTRTNATWNAWENVSLGSVVDYQEVAYGYNSGCPANGVAFNVLSEVRSYVTNNRTTQTFVLTGHNESSDVNSWKKFTTTSPTLTILYNHKPNTPTGMTSSPATNCTAATPTVVGDGSVSLYAPVSDRNGGVLGVAFRLWKSDDPTQTPIASSNPDLLTYKSGTTAVLVVPVTTLRTAAAGAVANFSWQVQVTDFNLPSDWSATCRFSFDATRTGAPDVTVPATETTIGQPATFTIAPPTGGSVPSRYLYQLNAGPPSEVLAEAGSATITLRPTRFTNTLTVTSLSAGGNIGDSASVTFNSAPAANAADADLTGDGVADLLTAGAVNGLPPGLWLGYGNQAATLLAPSNVGVNGNGISGLNGSSDFDGAQVVTGRFTGNGLQDVLAYYPTGTNAGAGSIIHGNGDGSVLQAQRSGNQYTIDPAQLADEFGNSPSLIANAGDSSGRGLPYPDLIGISGDSTNGYRLNYHPNFGNVGAYLLTIPINALTPTGGTDWDSWTIATAQVAGGTALFLWHRDSGALHLWTNLTVDLDTGTATYTPYVLAGAWNPGAALRLHAADINGDGIADLWAVGAGETATPWLVGDLANGTGTITAQPVKTLLTSTHTWQLNDQTSGPVTTATDSTGNLPATAAGNAVWNVGDMFDPDVSFDGTNSVLSTSGPALATNADFTVAAWVKPNATGGTVLSQDGNQTAGFRLWAEAGDSSWRFALPRADTTSPTWDVASAGANTVRPGVWTHLAATYKRSTGDMNLYVNGANVARATHSTTWNASGPFRIGNHRSSATTHSGHFNGQLAAVQTWDGVWIGNASIYGALADGRLTYSQIDSSTGRRTKSLVSVDTLGFTPVAMAVLNATTVLVTAPDGVLYRVDIVTTDRELNFNPPAALGTGWSHSRLSYDGAGKLFGIANGVLRRYDITSPKPTAADIVNYTTIDSGFSLRTLTTTGPGWILGTYSAGELLSYQIRGVGDWDRYELRSSTWDSIEHLVSPGGGVYYGRDVTGRLRRYLDSNPYDGSGSDLVSFSDDPVDYSGWHQVVLSAQPNTVG